MFDSPTGQPVVKQSSGWTCSGRNWKDPWEKVWEGQEPLCCNHIPCQTIRQMAHQRLRKESCRPWICTWAAGAWKQMRGQDDKVVFWESQFGGMSLQQRQSGDSPIESRTALKIGKGQVAHIKRWQSVMLTSVGVGVDWKSRSVVLSERHIYCISRQNK